jgi:hypothetical protein
LTLQPDVPADVLLDDVGQFMRKQPAPAVRGWRILLGRKNNVIADSESERVYGQC